MEALLRWDHPEFGMVPPVEFVPLAEESGLIVPIGDWVLTAACRQNKAWQDAGLPKVSVAVNVSSRQFVNHDLKQAVLDALATTGLEPRYLELEITESAMMRNQEASAQALRELREIGVSVALDDFGTGYSSLSYLRLFPLDSLKIDRSFVQGLPREPEAVGVINAIIAMAHVLKLKVVAEGVETEDQEMFLTGFGCDEMQGYLFSRPVPAAEFALLLENPPQRS
jgi:EAL domain-containing protein (putative c-di-GMP-specific phosphodiesterase class I)